MSSLQGQMLIASPRLNDPNFRQSVVLIVQHSDEGALGLVLNRPTDTSIREVWQQVSKSACESEELLRLGGPCQGPLMVLHNTAALADSAVFEGVYLTGEPEQLEQLLASPGHRGRYFVGYAGWSSGQLEAELEDGSWITTAARFEHVFYTEDDLWKLVTQEIATSTVLSALNLKHVPRDPRMN